MNHLFPRPRTRNASHSLTFAPLAWLKLQYFCHSGDTEIGGFGITAADNPLYLEEFVTVAQETSPASVRFSDNAVADYFDDCVDRGLKPEQFARIWLHTHPGDSVTPTGTDESTFARCFGACDWAVMFILGRTGQTYARLALRVGPGAEVLLPVQVDWSVWPAWVGKEVAAWPSLVARWQREYAANIRPVESFVWPLPADRRLLPAACDGWPDEEMAYLGNESIWAESTDGEYLHESNHGHSL
jgi:hypothetical protein